MKNQIYVLLTLALSFLFFSCTPESSNNQATSSTTTSSDAPKSGGQANVQDESSAKNILQIAMASKDHTTLAAAVQAAGLENVLANAGPLTVFAPTNAAFDLLPAGTVETLLKPENKEKLARIIKYHAAPGNYQGKLFKDGMRLFQASGHYVKVKVEGDKVSVDGANILGTVQAANGVVHVVDKVMLPPE